MNFNLGNMGNALSIANSGNGQWQMPNGVNDALKKTGSSYSIPQQPSAAPRVQAPSSSAQAPAAAVKPPEWAQQGQQIADALPAGDGTQEYDEDGKPKAKGLKNSPLVGFVKKAASLVSSYYTGGMSGLAMNAGSQVVSQNNPQAGGAISAAGSLFG